MLKAAVGLWCFQQEKTMNNRTIDLKSGAIELNDEQLKSVTGGGRKGGNDGSPVRYMEFRLEEVLISSVSVSGR